jgi:F-type H+-transporting ATPase subunit epsilon
MAFKCVVVTPDQQVLDETVTQAIVPAHDGLIGIMTGRAPLLIQLGTGPLRVDLASGQKRYFFVDGGVAQMKDNKLTILSEDAKPASEIDAEAARAAYTKATATKASKPEEVAERDHQINRARAMQQLAGK